MKQGDIFLVNFEPSVGHEYKKVRPSIIIQNKLITQKSPYITVMPLSSQVNSWREPDIYIPKDNKNKLISDSVIRVQQISSFDKQRFIKKIGETNSPILRKIRGYIRKHFQL